MAARASDFAALQADLLGDADLELEAGRPSTACVELRRLSYTVAATSRRAPPRTVLFGVSCAFQPGRLSAIMGASGSGKTSLLTLIRGWSAPGSTVDGDVLVNGKAVDSECMREIACGVPQQDVFLSALTPREMLTFAAELRLSALATAAERRRRVEHVLAVFRLQACADTPIGDELQGLRGISGGEKRRLSVGLSIIGGLPPLLLCDEPTSGLDSAAASCMVHILRSLASAGVTVLCAIHQPSYAVFREFDSVLLLEAGQAMYFGGVCGIEAYFARYGSPTPEHVNPAHHYITEIQRDGSAWGQRWLEQAEPHGAHGTLMNGSLFFTIASPRSATESRLGRALRRTVILSRRTLLENFKNQRKFLRGVRSRLPPSIMVGLFFWQIAAAARQSTIHPLRGVLFVAAQNPLIETFYAGATASQLTRGLLKREYYDGLYHMLPYFLSYYIGFLAMQVPWALAWAMPLYMLVGLPLEPSRMGVFLLTVFLVILAACAAGSAVGTRTESPDGNRAVLMPLLIPMVLFSGYVVPFEQIPQVWKPIYYLSPVQWATTILERNHYQGVVFEDCDGDIPFFERHCYATGEELIEATANPWSARLGIGGMLLVFVAYISIMMALHFRGIRACVLDGRI